MDPLPYQHPTEHRTTTRLIVLWTLPIGAFCLGMLTGTFALGEPFGIFRVADAAVFFGAPVAIVALGVLWYRLALAYRVHRAVIVLVVAWFVLAAAGVAQETLRYLREPWNV